LDEGAPVVAFDLFKGACDFFDEDEFQVWYARHVDKLFEGKTALQIKACLDHNDPRLNPDFIFPGNVGFLPGLPIAYGLFRGSYRDGFELLKGTPELAALCGVDEANSDKVTNIFFYESILESKVSDLFGHLVYKKKATEGSIDPFNYFYHVVAKIQGERRIVRLHCDVTNGMNSPMHVRMQDVSSVFHDLLTLPPLPY
jgi:hypothetical protein